MRTLPMRYGSDFVSIVDGRSRFGREVRDRLFALVADLGGEEPCRMRSAPYAGERYGWTSALTPGIEDHRGPGVDIGPHTQLVGSLVGLYRVLGLKRQARNVTLRDVWISSA